LIHGQLQTVPGVARFQGFMAVPAQGLGNGTAEGRFIINYQDFTHLEYHFYRLGLHWTL
jgi:hypothetical protein